MTSSIYPLAANIDFVGFVATLTITNAGTGYPDVPVVTIAAPSGTTATADATISNGKVVSFTITEAGAGYTSAPVVTIAAPSSGVTATATAVISNGSVVSFSITEAGSGYTSAPTVTIADPSGTIATATATASGGIIQTVTIVIAGSGYTLAPVVTIADGNADATITATIASLASDTDILNSDIVITSELVSPGGGGILRLYFTFVFDTTPGDITVTNNGNAKGALNADNDSQLVSNGYYRFDIDVESGDNINLELTSTASATAIASVNFIRAHLVQFGA